jgi:hypothetical protein
MNRRFIENTRVTEPSPPRLRSSPQDGDVVVTREAESRVHYTVRQLPGTAQFSAAVRDEAVRLARGFGQKHEVDVWYSEAGAYRLLEACRRRTLSHRANNHLPEPVAPEDVTADHASGWLVITALAPTGATKQPVKSRGRR